MSNKESITTAQVAAWTTTLFGFGLVQGVIYLKAYWSPFGVDPFQFGNAGDLAMVGLTGIGITLALMLGAALVGSYLGSATTPLIEKHRWLGWVIAFVITASIVMLIFLVDFGIHLVAGMLLTWALIWLAHRSPDLPAQVKSFRALPYIALAVAYVPMAAHYYGQRKANEIMRSAPKWQIDVSDSVGLDGMNESTRLAGRLGNDYIFYDPLAKSVSIVPSTSVERIVIKKKPPQ